MKPTALTNASKILCPKVYFCRNLHQFSAHVSVVAVLILSRPMYLNNYYITNQSLIRRLFIITMCDKCDCKVKSDMNGHCFDDFQIPNFFVWQFHPQETIMKSMQQKMVYISCNSTSSKTRYLAVECGGQKIIIIPLSRYNFFYVVC